MNDTQPIYSYTDKQAVEDGLYTPVLQKGWPKISSGKPIFITTGVKALGLSDAAYIEIWNDFVTYVKNNGRPQNFGTFMNGHRIWVGDNGTSYAIFLPEEY